ncbi:glycosyltransferase family 2 protein [Aquimarina agarivorans]|uniref:glycosyltransferase family 2 protein n=1 Tax=Aquimarina agarivorans TaxID=980584 RepID=UPI000248EB6B|nr:glycosyltransferase family 2 protein [Aquimarina agarivorans]
MDSVKENKNKISITAIILTYNEQQHLARCLHSLKNVCGEIVIIDSFSTDNTAQIASQFGARFYQNEFVSQANQLNWGIETIEINTEWVIRVDADEFLNNELQSELLKLSKFGNQVNGVRINRMMYFMDMPLKKGGMYPIKHLRIWRNGKAFCEQRWMDERMVLTEGVSEEIKGDLIDHNLNGITWWTQKHNNYATREAIDILDKLYNFTNSEVLKSNFFGNSEERRRWLKYNYLKLPLFVRPFLFWFIRYFLQGGFLEGKRGFIWNILQCFWYRFLVDVKIFEAYHKGGTNKEALIRYFKDEFGYDVTKIG